MDVPFIEDGREAAISEGAGSIALELLREDPGAFDAVVVPLGNGAMLGGIATWVKHVAPRTRVVGIVASGAPSMELSWRTHRVIETERADTIADGIAVRVPIPEAVSDLQEIVDDMLRVEDASIVRAMQMLFAHLRLAVEPAGAVGLAALLDHGATFRSQRVATVLCGANLTDAQRRTYGLVEGVAAEEV
jgi:threonine dehydratase